MDDESDTDCNIKVDDVSCGICHEILYQAVGLECGHFYCSRCIKQKETCPLCRRKRRAVNRLVNNIVKSHFPKRYKQQEDFWMEQDRIENLKDIYKNSYRKFQVETLVEAYYVSNIPFDFPSLFDEIVENATDMEFSELETEIYITWYEYAENYHSGSLGPYIMADNTVINFSNYDVGDASVIHYCAIQNLITTGSRASTQTVINWIKKYEETNNIKTTAKYWDFPSLDECYRKFLKANDSIIRTKYQVDYDADDN